MSFTEEYACRSGIHCKTCRGDACWRSQHGAPESCPHTTFTRSIRRLRSWLRSKGWRTYSFKPGDLLASSLHALKIDKPTCSKCQRWRKWMNRRGWLSCLWHWKLIYARMVRAARELNPSVPFDLFLADLFARPYCTSGTCSQKPPLPTVDRLTRGLLVTISDIHVLWVALRHKPTANVK